jgi:hypothetical protein
MATNENLHTSPTPGPAPTRKGLSVRALLLSAGVSLLGAVIANYHDGIILHQDLSQHNVIAPLAVAAILLFAVLVNPLLSRLSPRHAFSGAELGVALALALLVTPISSSFCANWVRTVGYMRSQIEAQHPDVKPLSKANVFEVLPENALLSTEASRVFDDGVAPSGGGMAHLSDIPWSDWLAPALYWAPLMLTFLILAISMAHLLYRQWAERELVPFPLAEFAADLVRRDRQRPLPDICYNRSFWIGFGLLFFIFTINGLIPHIPKMVEIPLKFNYIELSRQFPFLKNSLEGYSLLRGSIYFAVVAAAVLLPAEISFTSWFTWPVMIVCTYLYYTQTGQAFTGVQCDMMQSGSFWAMSILILYAGRTFYLALFRQALGLGPRSAPGGPVDPQSVRVCRVFLLALVGFVVILNRYGIPLDLAIIWTLALLTLFLVTCRIVAEMGIPWTPMHIGPLSFLLSALGEKAIGAKAFAFLAVFHNLTLNTTVYVSSAAINAAHVENRSRGQVSGARILIPFLTVMVVALVATAMWVGYSSDGAANDYPSRDFKTINAVASSIQNRYLQGDTPPAMRELLSRDTPFMERWAAVRVDPRFPPMFACGAALILLTGVARLRFSWFPFHPLPLVLLGSWLMSRYCFSFFLGWLIKVAIIKIGGGRLFEKTKPFFVGVVTGLAFIYASWIVANIFIFRANNFTFEPEWALIFRDMFSS